MVKIRKFFESSQSWEKVDNAEGWHRRSENFTEYEVRRLKELFADRTPIERLTKDGTACNTMWIPIREFRLHNISSKKFADRPTFLSISKYEDDWFLCHREGKYEFYKCDQLSGLIDFINWFFETKQYLK